MTEANPSFHVVVLGGGAAGFFAAIACAEANPSCQVTLLERSSNVLAKVKISGGGRCNVTHACFDPSQLVTYYPRGSKALHGPFTRFQPRDTVQWFEDRGVPIKTEEDGRMFPVSNVSQTIIDCLIASAAKAKVVVRSQCLVNTIQVNEKPHRSYRMVLDSGETIVADRLIFATGSNPEAWEWAKSLGHSIETPVPSLFTFTIQDSRLEGLSGVSVPNATLRLEESGLSQEGALLITHWGLSGPAVLKLSAWGARFLHEKEYQAKVRVNWLPEYKPTEMLERLRALRERSWQKKAPGDFSFGLPRRLWVRLAFVSGVTATKRWTEISNESLKKLAMELQEGVYVVSGKSTFKEEFVTCGGVRLNEVDFRTMESKLSPHLYFAGEVLDIDAVTGGFNFQSAWTTGWLAGRSAGGASD